MNPTWVQLPSGYYSPRQMADTRDFVAMSARIARELSAAPAQTVTTARTRPDGTREIVLKPEEHVDRRIVAAAGTPRASRGRRPLQDGAQAGLFGSPVDAGGEGG